MKYLHRHSARTTQATRPCFARCAVLFLAAAGAVFGASIKTTVVVTNSINGPTGMAFRHPGVLVNMDQLLYSKSKVVGNLNPWKATYNDLLASPHATRTPNTSHMQTATGYATWKMIKSDAAYDEFLRDGEAAYSQALLWFYTGNEVYAQRAVTILNAYSAILKLFEGSNGPLFCSWNAAYWCRAAEILRYTYTPSAGSSNYNQTNFARMLNEAFLPLIRNDSGHESGSAGWWNKYNSNWDWAAIEALMSIAVYLNDGQQFDAAISRWKYRIDRNIYHANDGSTPINNELFHGVYTENCSWLDNKHSKCLDPATADEVAATTFVTGRNKETCRDFEHAGFSLAAIANAAETAWIQKRDLYNSEKTRFTAGLAHQTQLLLYWDINRRHVTGICNPLSAGYLNGVAPDDGPLMPAKANGRQVTSSEVAYSAYVTRGLMNNFTETPIPNYSNANIPMFVAPNGQKDPLRTAIDRYRGSLGQAASGDESHVSLWETLTHHQIGDGNKTKYVESHFNSGNLTGWTTYWGTWSNPSSYAKVTNTSGTTWLKSNAAPQANFDYSVRIRMLSGGGGLSFRAAADLSTGYEVAFTGGNLVLRKRSGGFVTLASVPFTVNTSSTYPVEVRANGTSIRVVVDGLTKISVTDATFSSGVFAVWATGACEVHYDDIVATTNG